MAIKVKDKHKNFVKEHNPDDNITLQDYKTKLYLKALNPLHIIKIDDGIIENTHNNIKKCDYLSYSNTHTNMIELKGSLIDDAFTQIIKTIENLQHDDFYEYLLQNQNVYALIVSPARQKFPKGIDSKERMLTRKLGKINHQNKKQNINNFIKYVTIKNDLKQFCEKGNKIQCSGQAPFPLQ